jgi:uncharacterized protein (TIGR03382 family)
MRAPFLLAAAASLFFATVSASADVPGGGSSSHCDVTDKGCTRCSGSIGEPPDAGGAYADCVAAATANGLVDACQDYVYADEDHWFCPKGVTIEKTSSGCSIEAAPAGAMSAMGLGVLAALGLLVARRRARR